MSPNETSSPDGWSFITVSHKPTLVETLRSSLSACMGSLPWELVAVDGTRHDLFTGYNEGAGRARYDRLVFIHHDVVVLGNHVALEPLRQAIDDDTAGVTGVIGVRFLMPSGTWWGGNVPQQMTFGLSRGMAMHPEPSAEMNVTWNDWPGGLALFGQVIVVDGVVLACHRRTFNRLGGFDALNFKGFHFYDVDFSLRAHLLGLRNSVVPFPIRHASRGAYDEKWEACRQAFVRKHARSLPIALPADNVRFH
jgi:GT2 family glycosyltransferase